jgi:hypothetical protein
VEFQWDSFAKITAAILPESGLAFRADFVRASVKVKPRVARSMAIRKRLVSCPGLVVFPISRQVDFPPRRVDFDFQIRGLRLLLVSQSRLDWLLAKLPVRAVTRGALLLPPEPLLDWPAPVSSTPNREE